MTMKQISFELATFEKAQEKIARLTNDITSVQFRAVEKWDAPLERLQEIIDLLPHTVTCFSLNREELLHYIKHIKKIPESVESMILKDASLNECSLEELVAFFNCLKKDMKFIDLRANGLTNEHYYTVMSDLKVVLAALPEELETLDISENGFDKGDVPLAQFLAVTEGVPRLLKNLIWQGMVLGDNLTENDVATISSSLSPHLEALDISNCEVSGYREEDDDGEENPAEMEQIAQRKRLSLVSNLPRQLKTLIWPGMTFKNNATEEDVTTLFSRLPPALETLDISGFDFSQIKNADLSPLREEQFMRIFKTFEGTPLSTLLLNKAIVDLYPEAAAELNRICYANKQNNALLRGEACGLAPLVKHLLNSLDKTEKNRFFTTTIRENPDASITASSPTASSSMS